MYFITLTIILQFSIEMKIRVIELFLGFFNPQSFLTAIMQSTARKNELPLDRMSLSCEVTKKNKDELTGPPREGANIHGLFMEGARCVCAFCTND